MQQTGCLKKRRRRNISKVGGIGIIPYDESQDTFTGNDMYQEGKFLNKKTIRTDKDTRLSISALRTLQEESSGRRSSTRPTRIPLGGDPTGSLDYSDEDEEAEMESNYEFNDKHVEHDPDNKRPYFISQMAMGRLKMLIILGQASGTFPWSWNQEKHQIDKWGPQKERLWWWFFYVTSIQTTFLSGFQIYSYFYRLEPGNYRMMFMWSFSVVWYSSTFVFNLNMYYYKDKIRQYINTLFIMNKRFMDQYVRNCNSYEDSGNVLIRVSVVTNITQVFISVTLFIRIPFKPWYLYSYIHNEANPWYWLIPGALHEFMIVGQAITSYMLLGWIVVTHANSTSFWLREIHNHNDDGFGSPEIRHPNHSIRIYRSLQILCQSFNNCMSHISVPMLKVHIWIGTVPTGYVLIKSMNHVFLDEFPGSLTFPFAIIDCTTGGFAILTVSAEMYDLGCGFIDSWSRTKQKDFRRILMSCPTLKVKVGRFYEITVATMITYFKSIVDYVVDCLLTFK